MGKEWKISAPLWFVISEMRLRSLGLADLKKVKLHRLGEGRRVLINQLTLPQQSKALSGKKRVQPFWKRKLPSESKDVPSISTWAGPEPPAIVRLRCNRCESRSRAHFPQTALSSAILKGWHWASPETQKLISSHGSESSPGCLGPFGDSELQQLTSPDTKQPARPFTANAPSWGSLALPVRCWFPNTWDKKVYTRLQVKNPKLSPSHALNTLVWARLLFGMVVLFCISFTKPSTRCKTRCLKTTKPEWCGCLPSLFQPWDWQWKTKYFNKIKVLSAKKKVRWWHTENAALW